MNKRSLLLGLAFIFAASAAEAKLKLPALVGDHMVLQKGKPVVWGWADAGQKVTVTMAGKTVAAQADADGKWKATLNCPQAGGPYSIAIKSDEAVTISDVLVGEVWIGSGQSNMEFAVKASTDADKAIASAKFPKIRLFQVERVASMTPLDDVQGSWQVCDPSSVGDFSAVAYYFGRELHQTLKTPVGLVRSCWGGTAAESWTPREALDAHPAFADLLKQWDNNKDQIKTWSTGNDYDLWISDIRFIPKDPKDKVLEVSAEKAASMLGGSWMTSAKPGCTAGYKVEGKAHSGKGPAIHFSGAMKGGGWGGISTNLSTGPVDLSRYETVEFYQKGSGQFRMTLGQPTIGDYDYYAMANSFDGSSDWQMMQVDIPAMKQGGWGSPKPFTPEAITTLNFNVQVPYWPDIASVVYNAMGAPLTPMRIRGVVWYQGESNTGRPAQYQELLTTLITSWRKAWGEGDFPFLVIQLPNFMEVSEVPVDSAWAELREAQLKVTQTVPATGLVTTIDLGEANNIHPHNKTDVGHRAALWALQKVYGKKVNGLAPAFLSGKVQGPKVVLTFTNVGKGLSVHGGGELKGFSLAGDDGGFHWAKARIVGKTVEVSSADVKSPKAVRYAWASNPVCNLVSKDGLWAGPFRAQLAPRSKSYKDPTDDIPPPPGN